MNPGGDAAEQVVRLSLEGVEVAARITGNGAKNIAILLHAVLKEEQKTKGKTRLTNMLRTGKELKVYTVQQKDLKKFTQEAGALLRAAGQEQQRRERCGGCNRKSRGRFQDTANHRTLPPWNGANGIRHRQRQRTGEIFSGKGCTGEEGTGGKKRKNHGSRPRKTKAEGKPRFGEDGKRPSVRAKLEANKPLKWVDWND